MNWGKNRNKFFAFTFTAFFVVTGTYNAVVINSESHLTGSEVKFVKRLDEIYGVTVQGREVANSVSWQKLASAPKLALRKEIIQTVSNKVAAPETSVPDESIPVAAVQEDLTLSLVEVINQKKWQNGLPNTQFSGSLVANNGVIEELSVALPNGEGVSVSFSEMTGNVFEYDLNGELYSGMMYQVDQYAYMVTLTNGPLEGTRLRFSAQSAESQQQDIQNSLAASDVEVGQFGNNAEQYGNNGEQYGNNSDQLDAINLAQNQVNQDIQAQEINQQDLIQNDQAMQQQAMEAQGYNFNQEATM